MYISLQLHKEHSNCVGHTEMHSKFSDTQGLGLSHGTEYLQDLVCATPWQMPSLAQKDNTNQISVRPDPNDKHGGDAKAISPQFDVRAIAATAFALPDHHSESWPPSELRRRHLRRHHSAPAIISSAKKSARSSLSKEIGSSCHRSQRREKKRFVRQWSKVVSRATRLDKPAKDKGDATQGISTGMVPFFNLRADRIRTHAGSNDASRSSNSYKDPNTRGDGETSRKASKSTYRSTERSKSGNKGKYRQSRRYSSSSSESSASSASCQKSCCRATTSSSNSSSSSSSCSSSHKQSSSRRTHRSSRRRSHRASRSSKRSNRKGDKEPVRTKEPTTRLDPLRLPLHTQYSVLRCLPTASRAELKASYQNLMAMGVAKKRNAGPATQAAADQFLMQVETAYNLLKDPKLRKAYDRVLDPSAVSDREDTSEEERRKTKERKMRKDVKASKTEKKRRKGKPDFSIFEGKDLYQLLGASQSDPIEVIRKNSDYIIDQTMKTITLSKDFDQVFQAKEGLPRIKAARKILDNDKHRAAYDRYRMYGTESSASSEDEVEALREKLRKAELKKGKRPQKTRREQPNQPALGPGGTQQTVSGAPMSMLHPNAAVPQALATPQDTATARANASIPGRATAGYIIEPSNPTLKTAMQMGVMPPGM